MTINVNTDQRLLLEKINQYSDPNRRTDKLAVCMQQFGKHWDISHTAFVGLHLRSLGYATTFKDAGQYAQWNITPLGKAALCELRNVKEAEKVDKPCTWLVTGPEGEISVEQTSLKAAEALAEKWAREEPGSVYTVVAVLSTVQAEIAIKKVAA